MEQMEDTACSSDNLDDGCHSDSNLQNGRPAFYYGTVISGLYKLETMLSNYIERLVNYNYILTIAFVVVAPIPWLYMILQDWIPWPLKTASLFVAAFLFTFLHMGKEESMRGEGR